MFPCQDSAYRARYRLRRRPVTKLRIGPWEVHYDARGMRFYYEDRFVGEKAVVSQGQLPNAGSSKAAKYLIGRAAQISLVKIADLHDQVPFDPEKFRDVFEWRDSTGILIENILR